MLITLNSKLALPVIPGVAQKIDLYINSQPFSEECIIDANNDLEAVLKWLDLYKSKATTYRTYKREAIRFLLWCSCEVGKNLTALKVDDLEKYLKFLQAPPQEWCAPRGGKRSTNRPFVGALSIAAYQCSVRVINSLFNYLVKADYLRTNPLKLIRTSAEFKLTTEDRKYQVWTRMLEDDEWQAVLKALNDMPTSDIEAIDLKLRTQFLFAMLYLLGLRISEVAENSWNCFRQKDSKWWFFVKGKGGKEGHIPVNDKLLVYVRAYRKHLGKDPMPAPYETERMIVAYKNRKAYSLRMLYGMVKDIGLKASKSFPRNKLKRDKLRKFSPHWLRHLSASDQDKAGMSMSMIQENMRHASSQTTKIYIHAEDEARHAAIQNLGFSNVDPVAKVLEKQHSQIIKIKLKSMGIDGIKSFDRFIESVENNLFSNIKFKANRPKHIMLEEFSKVDKLREFYSIEYNIQNLSIDLESTVKSIQREAQCRLLSTTIELGIG